MAGIHIVWVSIALLLTYFSATAAEKKPELATKVCKNTTDFAFCRSAVYSDPRAATADRYELIDIVYHKAWINATNTRDFIASHIKSGECLKKCLGNYKSAIEELSELLNDLNSESYYNLDVGSLRVESSVKQCKKDMQRSSIIWERNENMIKLTNICYVVSKLF